MEVDDLAPDRGIDMAERRKHTEFGGVADEHIEPAIALVQGRAQLVELAEIAQIERYKGGAAPGGAYPVVGFLEAADRACDQHQMGAFAGKALGHRGADAARGSGNQRDLAGEPAFTSRVGPEGRGSGWVGRGR